MLAENSSLNGSIYELVKTVEFDMELDDDRFPMRVELLQCLSNPHQFRTRTWAMNFRDRTQEAKFYSERLIVPHDEMVDRGEGIFVDYSYGLSEDCFEFEADTQEAAIQVIVDNLKDFVNCFTSDCND
jgi:hypothetical protein